MFSHSFVLITEMEPLNSNVKNQRWKLKGNILRKVKNSNDSMALTWAPKRKRKRGKKNIQERTVEREREEGGNHGSKRGRMLRAVRNI